MADSQWYYAVAGEQLGPVSTAELRELIRAGNVGAEDLVWCEGMSDWTESRAVKALVPVRRVAKAASPAAAPAPIVPEVQVKRTRTAAPAARAADVSIAAPPVVAPPAETFPQVAAPSARFAPEPEVDDSPAETALPTPSFLSDSVATADSGLDMADDDAAEQPEANQYDLDDSVPDALTGQGGADSSESVSDDELSEPAVQPLKRRKAAPASSVASGGGAAAGPAPNALYSVFLLILWIVTALALMAVSIVFAIQWKKAADAAEQTATATTFVVWFVAVYCIARACERVLQLLGHPKP